ncbi:hypothetical protein PsYK624_070740 [Phanerochaete sordida]|uniref:Uncharacterized protein n=1 Tax=Phanerochaete sordida TaxID=48140 RepID=A0A9P3LEF2_9APHY|nr:hypothetical protein PsYK624_070740 [Phanerochaete sordida]
MTRTSSRNLASPGKRPASDSISSPAQPLPPSPILEEPSTGLLHIATAPPTSKHKKARVTVRVSQPVECDRCGYVLHILPKEDVVERLASHYRAARCQKAARGRMRRLTLEANAAAGGSVPPSPVSPLDSATPSSAAATDDGDTLASPLSPAGAAHVSCFQCGAYVELAGARYHVGQHVLRALLGVKERLKAKINPGTACGFCGRSGTCRLILPDEALQAPPDAQDVELVFSCERARMTSHDQARTYSRESPSTNVPVACAICLDAHDAVVDGAVHWKFGIFHHIRTAHPEHWDANAQRVKNIPETFVPFISVTARELKEVAPDATLAYPGPVIGR